LLVYYKIMLQKRSAYNYAVLPVESLLTEANSH